MKIVIIGSGNVAEHLAIAFKKAEIELIQIFGRNEKRLKYISEKTKIPFSTDNLADADLYLISVSDNAVEEVSQLIQKENSIVAHTCGSLPKEILKGNYEKACFYPLQTFSSEKELDYSKIPFFIEAETEKTEKALENLALKVSQKVSFANFEKRKYIHLTAVFACNFVNHLFTKAKEISDSKDIPFDYFFPLIEETFNKIKTVEPKYAQTGPARRGDTKILSEHEKMIQEKFQLKLYQLFNQSILKLHGKL